VSKHVGKMFIYIIKNNSAFVVGMIALLYGVQYLLQFYILFRFSRDFKRFKTFCSIIRIRGAASNAYGFLRVTSAAAMLLAWPPAGKRTESVRLVYRLRFNCVTSVEQLS
jgi:hypothetical protein